METSTPLAGVKRWRMIATSANGQPAVAGYAWDDAAGAYLPYGLTVLSIRAGKIDEIMAFLTPDVFSRFDLPASIR